MEAASNLPPEGLRSLLELGSEAAGLVDPRNWQVVYANSQLIQLGNSHNGSPEGPTIFELIPDLDTAAARDLLGELAAGKRDEAHIDCGAASSRTRRPILDVRVRRVETAGGVLLALVVGASASASDTEPLRNGGVDPLTGLSDRGFILDKLSKIIHGARMEDQRTAVLFIDVDGFKQVNDSYGHLVGDRVLAEVARRLAACVRAKDHIARFGGDEFLVLLERIDGREAIESVVRRIRAAFGRPISLPQGEVTLSVSVGAARAGIDGGTPEALIDAADRAMYAAKRATA